MRLKEQQYLENVHDREGHSILIENTERYIGGMILGN
tara:strand:+ start:314 stop:424 length:111 start_codon:yes stop_codon:yes gene_type:complete